MSDATAQTRLQAVAMTILLITALFATTVAFSTSVGATVDSASFTVTNDPVQADGTITVEGDVSTTGDVTFLIQDPDDNDFATVTKTVDNTAFSVTIDLSTLNFGDGLDDGEATISADEGSGFQSSEASTTFVVDTEYPTVAIDAPSDGADLTSDATISGTASDDAGLRSVMLSIQRSDGKYYDGSTWVTSETFVSVSGTTDWSYDTAANGLSRDDTFNVTVKAIDKAGHVRSWSSGPPVPSGNTLQIDYTVDTTAPTVSSVTVTQKDADDTVTPGDTVKVSATVTDAPAGVQSVETDASALGGSSSLTLSKQSGDTYYNTFTVQSPSASDGTVSLRVVGTDNFGNTQSKSDTVTLDTAIDSVETLTIQQDFVGIVADTNTAVRVTATGVTDAQGNPIASGDASTETASLTIAGQTYPVTVDDGKIDATIDPTQIPDDTAVGQATVAIAEADSQSATASVKLVHEAQGLEEGYQIAGTPMDAADVVFQGVSDVTTYDPTAENTKWVSPAEKKAGSGYYVYGDSGDARVGYTFEQRGQLRSTKLHEGYNLVAATPDLNTNDNVQVGTDLGDGVTVDGNTNVKVYVRDPSVELTDPSGDADTSAFDEVSGTTDVSGFEGYFVYMDSGEEIRTVDDEGYDASEGS